MAFIVFSENGKEYNFALPRLVHARTFAYNMQAKVREYLRDFTRRNREIKYIVDVGAHCGIWAIPYTLIFPDADILCLEPSKYNYEYLKFNTKNISRIEPRKMAAHNETGFIRIAAPSPLQRNEPEDDIDTGLISFYGASGKFQERVPADTLDNMVKRKVDWLKADVEGHEIPVLEGAQRILENDRPILQIEFRAINQKMANRSVRLLHNFIVDKEYLSVGEVGEDIIFLPQEVLE